MRNIKGFALRNAFRNILQCDVAQFLQTHKYSQGAANIASANQRDFMSCHDALLPLLLYPDDAALGSHNLVTTACVCGVPNYPKTYKVNHPKSGKTQPPQTPVYDPVVWPRATISPSRDAVRSNSNRHWCPVYKSFISVAADAIRNRPRS